LHLAEQAQSLCICSKSFENYRPLLRTVAALQGVVTYNLNVAHPYW
jgi:hypothetical protein